MDIAVVATFEDFDETLDRRSQGPGSGRRAAVQALARYLCGQPAENVASWDLLVLDWKSPPKGASAQEVTVRLGGGVEKKAFWGSRDQLLTKFPSSAWDVLVAGQQRRFVLDLAARLKSRRRAALVHGYDLPFGPWGQEQTKEQAEEHASLCEKFELLCASEHLADHIEKFGGGRFTARCCYAADYGLFGHPPAEMLAESKLETNQYVTCISPCPEKGLSVLLGLAEHFPNVQFLAVKTLAWTKAWYEPVLKKHKNIKVMAATHNMDDIWGVTRVLVVPSLYQEGFGLVATEAQLRGIPVVSTDSGGLAEANCVPSMVVRGTPLVFDQRTRELVVGMNLAEAEDTFDAARAGCLTMEQSRQTAISQDNYKRAADASEVEPFAALLRPLLPGGDAGALAQASREARLAATSFVERRRGQFQALLQKMMEEHVAAGDLKPMAAIEAAGSGSARFNPAPRGTGDAGAGSNDFDVDQDFTQIEGFDGMALASRCLVRLCEAGNLTVAAELMQARADVNMPEPDIGVTPLIAAANCGHLDLCKYLLRKEADVGIAVRDGTNRTALHAASQMGFASVVQLLLENRANPREEDLTKTTPLMLAVRYGHGGATDLLLKHKANPNQSDDQGQVPINEAVAKDRFDLVTRLLEHGALVNVRNMAGLEAISFSRTPSMQSIIMKHDVNF